MVEEYLPVWAEACNKAEVRWYLFKETLLCAEGYGFFPDELKYAQVLVYSNNVNKVLSQLGEYLPQNWQIKKQEFATHSAPILVKNGKKTILEIEVIHPIKDEISHELFSKKVQYIRKSLIKEKKFLKFVLRKKAKKIIKRRTEKALKTLFHICYEQCDEPEFYSNKLTAKKESKFRAEYFAEDAVVFVNGNEYPVFSAYKEYLGQIYGDYDNGLYDDIGCGLSVAEKEELKAHQKRCVEALEYVEQLSEEHGLRYCLIAGSALGAVRHGGFIPWDDDIDLGIRIEDIDRFESLIKEHLPPHFQLMQPAPDYPYPRMFSKICYEGRGMIDLWPLVPTYENGLRAIFTWHFAKLLDCIHFAKLGYKLKHHRQISKIIGFFVSDRMVMRMARYNERKYSKKTTLSYINVYSIYSRKKEILKREWLDNVVRAEFEGVNIPVVGETEQYLKHLYGDYMNKPAPWKRSSRHTRCFQK